MADAASRDHNGGPSQSQLDTRQAAHARVEPTIRQSKRERILDLFAQHLGKRYGSCDLHGMFGSSFRTRVSEINRDPSLPIKIFNETISADDGEKSIYWSEARPASELLFPEPMRPYRDPEEA